MTDDGKGMWEVRITKHRATWSWFTKKPTGGGFGSNQVNSKRTVLRVATRNIPPGTPYRLNCNGKITLETKPEAEIRGAE